MCELLGLNANTPADIRFSFAVLKQRGGNTGNHTDGWGIGAYSGKAARTYRDWKPCVDSEVAKFVEEYPMKSHLIISHIRKANRGKVCIENTHPFIRELYGHDWVFAHNGQLKGIKKKPLEFYKPVGTTDSEYAFCYLLDCIRQEFPERPSNPKKIWYFIENLSKDIMQHGVFSFLLSDAKYLYAFCGKKLCFLTREYPFQFAHYIDTDTKVNLEQYLDKTDVISIVASNPLTENEDWQQMEKGDFYVFKDGKPEQLVKDRRKINRSNTEYALSA